MQQANQQQPKFFKYFLNRELGEVYLTIAGTMFAISLIGIFIPIYLLQIGFSLKFIFLFYAIASGTFASTVYFSAKISSRIGIKHGILLSAPFLIIQYIILQNLTGGLLNGLFFIAPILGGLHSSFFWFNFHTDFARFSERKIRTRQVGGYQIFSSLLTVLAPTISGFILIEFGFNVLFIIVSILIFISIIPLFFSKEYYVHRKFSLKGIGASFKRGGYKVACGFISHGLVIVSGLAWILFIFLILKDYVSLGGLTSAGLFFAMISTFVISRLADKHGKGFILRIGALFAAFGWFFRIFARNFAQILGLNIFFGVIGPASPGGAAYDAFNYDLARKHYIAEVITIREICIHSTAALFMLLLFFVTSLEFAFILGIISSFLVIIFSYQKKKI